MKKMYVAVEEPLNGIGDTFEQFFKSPEEATREARSIWDHLTSSEKLKTHVYSAVITEDDLTDEAFDEINISDTDPSCADGICWGLYHSTDTSTGSSDSDLAEQGACP